MILERHIGKDLFLIKQLINDVSNKYSNFSHFIIKESESIKGYFSLYLYYEEDETNQNKAKVYVEHLESISYSDVGEIIKNASIDFDGYVKADILRNEDNNYIADVILTYKVPKRLEHLNLGYIKYISGGGGSGIYQHYQNFSIYKYIGEDFWSYHRSNEIVDWELRFNYAEDHILICKYYCKDSEEKLFKLRIDNSYEHKIKITKFISEKEEFYGSSVSEIEYKEVNVDDINSFVIELIKGVEDELNIKISKPTYLYFEDELKKHFEYKLENMLI